MSSAMSATANFISGRHYINGKWLTQLGDAMESHCPAQWDRIIGIFPKATAEQVQESVQAARKAFVEWRRTSRIARADLFDRLGNLIKRDIDKLAELMASECGKVLHECRAEIVEGLHMVQYVFSTARMPTGDVVASEIPSKDAFIRRKPRGVATVITPWNFPFAVPLWMIGPSLLEGNTVIFKPSEDAPAIGQRLVQLLEEAGFPAGVVNLLHGDGATGEALVRHPGVNAVLFTGSYEVGAKIQRLSAELPDRICACEMGSKSAVIVCADARLELAVTCALLSAFKTTGQRCVSGSRILVHESLFNAFAERFTQMASQVRFGDPLDTHSFAGPVINPQAVAKIETYNQLAKREGASVLLDGGRSTNPSHRGGLYVTPFLYTIDPKPGVRCVREEVFGPHVALLKFKTDEEAVRIYNDTEFGLSLAVITEDYRRMRYYREECEYGMGYVNLPCIGAEVHLPFGGVKKSGNGHPSAAGLIETVTHKTAWTVNHDVEVKMAQGLTASVTGGK